MTASLGAALALAYSWAAASVGTTGSPLTRAAPRGSSLVTAATAAAPASSPTAGVISSRPW